MPEIVRRLARALASSFTIAPRSDYLKAYPPRTAAQRMDDAWARTARDLNQAFDGFAKRVRSR